MVNAGGYGPDNYYSNMKFIKGLSRWDATNNVNLW
jgi:hypothetical protein